MNLHAMIARYIELLEKNQGPDSAEATSFVHDHRYNTRFVRCAAVAAFYWRTRR